MKAIEVTVNGVTDNLNGWSKRIGVSRQAIWAKIRYQGMNPENAVMEYVKRRGMCNGDGQGTRGVCA